ncbi:MAG: response regulator [Bryobacteraceae bacterium]
MTLIALIEDNPADAFLIEEAIARHTAGLKLLAIRDGEEAIRLIEQADADEAVSCPALILLDLNLPTKTGEEVLAHIRASGRCAGVPVVVVTSSDSPQDRERAERLGADRYFRKPADYDAFMQLGAIVKELLERI